MQFKFIILLSLLLTCILNDPTTENKEKEQKTRELTKEEKEQIEEREEIAITCFLLSQQKIDDQLQQYEQVLQSLPEHIRQPAGHKIIVDQIEMCMQQVDIVMAKQALQLVTKNQLFYQNYTHVFQNFQLQSYNNDTNYTLTEPQKELARHNAEFQQEIARQQEYLKNEQIYKQNQKQKQQQKQQQQQQQYKEDSKILGINIQWSAQQQAVFMAVVLLGGAAFIYMLLAQLGNQKHEVQKKKKNKKNK